MPITLTIDGRQVEVEPPATILDAARALGIAIPTLCHRDGVEPIGSCFLCAVQVEGRRNLIPACTAPVAQDMAVTTDSDDVRTARRMALELLLSDHVGDCEAPCTLACPAGLDIPTMLRHIAAGRPGDALALIRQRIPLAGVLGRICPRYCERVCRRRELDEPIAICALKRFPADADRAGPPPGVPPRREPTGKRVAIVGAGPAGLSAAFYLLQWGHACTLHDAGHEPGGMLRCAIPEFRLPRAALDADVETVRRLGADFRLDTRLGTDVAFDDLYEGFDAVLLATGAQAEDLLDPGVAAYARSALEFLHVVASGERPEFGDHVVVLGSGSEALDAARTARRLTTGRVTVVCETSRKGLRTFGDHLNAAEAEGIAFDFDTRAVDIDELHGGQLALVVERQGGKQTLLASTVIGAPPRHVETDIFESMGLAVAKGRVRADRATLATEAQGVFAAGDCVTGPAAAVRAVAAGRQAALSMDRYLGGREPVAEAKSINVRMGRLTDGQKALLFRGVERLPRAHQPVTEPARRRVTFEEVERGLSPDAAAREAARCLECDCAARDACALRRHATEHGAKVSRFDGESRPFARDDTHPDLVYESGKCILCQLCVRITDRCAEPLGMSLIRRGFDTRASVPFGQPMAKGLTAAAAEAVAACPTGALASKDRTPPPP